jgi:SAM-dependent MidA family methyltransferase
MTVAAFMELALYHPEHGYYAARAQRSGREGDFYTSVDVSPMFGELLAIQIAEMGRLLAQDIDLVEAAAGNGRLARDVLDALERDAPDVYAASRVHLVERSAGARESQRDTLAAHAAKLASADRALPSSISGVLYANELLDAMPVHVVTMNRGEPREIVVGADGDRLVEQESPLSSDALREAIDRGPAIPDGVRVEISLAAMDWMREVARRLTRGFVLLVDYGDEAHALRSATRPDGTLRAFAAHRVSGHWLASPGEQDLTAHVDFTAIARAATEGGLDVLGRVDQTRFLLGLGAVERLQQQEAGLTPRESLRRRLALKSLLVPGSIGSTHHFMIFGKNVSSALAGLSLAR